MPSGNSGHRTASAIVAICAGPQTVDCAREAATLAGGRLTATLGFDEAPERLAMQAAVDIILVDAFDSEPGALEQALVAAVDCADQTGARIVAVFGDEQIDMVAARLFGHGVQLLCEPSLSERVAALAIAGRREPIAFHDATRDSASDRIDRLNEEVARIARTLARLTARDGNGGVRDTVSNYGAPPPTDSIDGASPSPSTVRGEIRARRLRDRFFSAELFADPAWDMLLDLFAAELEHGQVSISSLCIAAAVPPTTALRWIATMTDTGLFRREPDPQDGRRVFIALSEQASKAMRGYFGAVTGVHNGGSA